MLPWKSSNLIIQFVSKLKNGFLKKPEMIDIFSHWIKQELHPIEIRHEAEMNQFVVVENQLPVS